MNAVELETKIDSAVLSARESMEIARDILDACLSSPPIVSPITEGSEGWYWPWNRVGFQFLDQGRDGDASLIFEAAYLAALRLQSFHEERYHKGMPLCNIAFARIRSGNFAGGRVAAMLGTIEDVITDGTGVDTKNYKNLLTAGLPQGIARAVIQHVITTVRRLGRTPLFPETVLATFAGIPFGEYAPKIAALAAKVAPQSLESNLDDLRTLWDPFSEHLSRFQRAFAVGFGNGASAGSGSGIDSRLTARSGSNTAS